MKTLVSYCILSLNYVIYKQRMYRPVCEGIHE